MSSARPRYETGWDPNCPVVDGQAETAESEVRQCIEQPRRVFRRRLDEQVEILGESRLGVKGHRVAADDDP